MRVISPDPPHSPWRRERYPDRSDTKPIHTPASNSTVTAELYATDWPRSGLPCRSPLLPVVTNAEPVVEVVSIVEARCPMERVGRAARPRGIEFLRSMVRNNSRRTGRGVLCQASRRLYAGTKEFILCARSAAIAHILSLTVLSNVVAYPCRHSRAEDRRHAHRPRFLWMPLTGDQSFSLQCFVHRPEPAGLAVMGRTPHRGLVDRLRTCLACDAEALLPP